MKTNYIEHEHKRIFAFIKAEAARFRARNEGADQAVASHFEILVDQLKREEHYGRPSHSEGVDNE